MKISATPLLFFLLLTLLSACDQQKDAIMRQEQELTSGWRFSKDTDDEKIAEAGYDDSAFQEVTLPHTAHIEPLVVNNQWQGLCWYRKNLAFSQLQRSQKHFLYFEGAMQQASVYFNGTLVSEHAGGYLPFIVDITDLINFEKTNLLAVKLVNTNDTLIPPGKPLQTLDFNMYGGIYRPVRLISTPQVYLTNPMQTTNKEGAGGVFVRFDSLSPQLCQMTISAHVANEHSDARTLEIEQTLRDATGHVVAAALSDPTVLPANQFFDSQVKLTVDSPELWSPEHPYLYHLVTKVYDAGQLTDSLTTNVGIRELQLTAEGFYLNGEKTFLRGTNRHQEYPYLGYALSDEAHWRDAVKIKEAGFDMVRLSHYPHSESFMDACDALGLITMNCIPGWQYNGNEIFKENVLANTRDLIRRDRNHPSVFFWELSLNESGMEPEFMDRILAEKEKEFGDQQAITCAWIDYPGYDLFIPARQHGTPPDYWNNYKSGMRPVFIAEYGDWEYYAQNAGFNQTAFSDLKEDERTSRQFRGSGEKRLLQQALNFQEAANSNRKGKTTIGHANWLMFDYNRGYSNDIESSGIADIYRIPKFTSYFYQSQRDAGAGCQPPALCVPMVFIASYWSPESSTDVRVFSNCDQVELRLNGKTIALQYPDRDENSTHLKHPPFTFHLNAFEPGQLTAFGYIDGEKVAGHWVRTPETPQQLKLSIDEAGIPLAPNDMVFVRASIIDKNGTVCPVNDVMVNFYLDGPGELIGDNPIRSEAGVASLLLKTNLISGELTITAQAKELTSDTIAIQF